MSNLQQDYQSPVSSNDVKSVFPTEIIDLPSGGYYYDSNNPLSSGRIELLYPTAKEEDILTSKNLIDKGIVIDTFIQSLIVNKSISLNTMLLGDKNAIILASRILAYGADYPVEINCPKCEDKSELNINIAEMQSKEVDMVGTTKGINLFEFLLPTSKSVIKFKILTHGDEMDIDTELKSMKKLKIGGDSEVTTRLKYAIQSVNGETDRMKIKSFVDSMRSSDSLALRRKIFSVSPDVDMHFNYTCPQCDYSDRRMLPLGIQFFWPSTGI